MATPTAIPAFRDNYIWCLADPQAGKALVVDPGQAAPVEAYLERHGLVLDTVLVTHHHPDHVGGIGALRNQHPNCRVVGPADSPFRGTTETVREGDTVQWQGFRFRVLSVPGHTLDHIAYFTEPEGEPPLLFCGDTLFVCGCGRLFEGSPAQMRHSLAKLRALPDTTRVHCAHEYTLANLTFARSFLPDDTSLVEFERQCRNQRDAGVPTVPSVLAEERRLNPFLRWDEPSVAEAARRYAADRNLPAGTDDEGFAAIRHAKDHF